jgi:hypothetical protein
MGRHSRGTARHGKKMSKKVMISLLVLVVVGGTYLTYGLVSGNWLLSMGALPSGFISSTFSSVNGYELGTPQFTGAGIFAIPANGMTFHGRLQYGSVFYDGATDLGWIQDGNTSIAVQQLDFHQSLLGYTYQTFLDQVPGVNLQAETLGLQYKFQYFDCLGTHLPDRDMTYYVSANTLSLPGNWFTCVNQRLDMTVQLNIQLDPSLLGFTSFNTTDQYFNFTGAWAGILNAKSGAAFKSGFVSEPGTTILDANDPVLVNPPTDAAGLSGGGSTAIPSTPAGTGVSAGAFDAWITAHDPAGGATGFGVLTSGATTMYQAGASDLGMGDGDPITLTEGNYNANASLDTNPTHYQNFFSDDNRGNVMGYIPMSIRPQTTITSTTYEWNEIRINQDYWGGVNPTGSQVADRSLARPTAIAVRNRWVMQLVDFTVIVAANYVVHPLNCGSNGIECVDIQPPMVNGTDNVFNPGVTDKLNAIGGGTNLWDDIAGFFGSVGGWVVIAVVAVVVVLFVYYYLKNRQGGSGSSGSQGVTNVYYSTPQGNAGKTEK